MKTLLSFVLFVVISHPTPAKAAEAALLLDGYHLIQTALAKDEFPSVKDLSARYLSDLNEWLKDEKETHPQYKNVKKALEGATWLSGTQIEAEQRKHFAVLSEGIVSFIRLDTGLQAKYQLFFCPMVEGFAYWVQPKGEKINNPYMGLSMPMCGSKKPW